ncbi:MAG: hypothetical protein A3G76_13035 [Acidobacteria bacterium RIFCSPLOWO2_12_FULL_65_11]|nr:MAG: hypothetical protein A3H95_03415 [Acidobacteria bacterium RIFCSPLOWO2_02_FULL_64_15]OFW32423.1 MAG: hypothetical protein A3G76_13035 [Acidobacteria bacterium RIFCSPLOWO2_12_FULL_65_11]
MGVAELLTAAGVLIVIQWTDAGREWRLAAVPFLWLGVLGILQAKARTCVALAARRTCDAELAGRLTEADAETLARRGRAILWRTTTVAGVLTLLTLLLP